MAKKKTKSKLEYVSCNLCGSDKTRRVMSIDGFHIVQCKRCGLKYVNPRLKEKELHEIYDEDYYHNDAFKGSDHTFYGYDEYVTDEKVIRATFGKRLRVINKHAKKGQMLDIGCAVGFFLDMARKTGWNVQGLELSTFACKYAKEKFGIKVQNKTLEDAKFKKETFDGVTLFDVIEHVPDPSGLIKEINRVMKKGGIFAITTPNIGSLGAKVLGKRWEEVKRIREHIYFFSQPTLRRMLRKNGFEIVHSETAGRYFTIDSFMQRGKILSKPIFTVLEKCMRPLGLSDRLIWIDPRYKMTLYARKVR